MFSRLDAHSPKALIAMDGMYAVFAEAKNSHE
jgi:hypothetical protein